METASEAMTETLVEYPPAPKGRWKVGGRWGRLTVTSRWREPITVDGVTDSHGPVVLMLRCDCGHEFHMGEGEFHHRRMVVTGCGREECKAGDEFVVKRGRPPGSGKRPRSQGQGQSKRGPGRPRSEHGECVGVQFWLPIVTIQMIDRWAEGQGQGMSRSAAVRVLVERAVADYDVERGG